MNLSPVFRQRFFDSNGAPLAAGQLFSYAAGTTTPQATYSNASGSANTNPVVLDSQGYADVWLDPTLAYKLVLKDVSSALIWSVDNVQVSITGISTWASTQVYQQGQIVADSGGTGMLYVSLTNSNLNNALTSVSNWRVFNGNIRTVSTSVTLLVTDDLVRSNSTAGNLTQTLPPCSTTPIGKKITVKDVGSGGNTTTVKGSGTDNVDGNNTYAFALTQYVSSTFINNGTSWDAVLNTRKTPAVQTYASGSGTYTTPTGALYLRVLLVGGGGGGGGGAGANSGSAQAGSNGGAGGNTTFGSSFLTAAGGGAGLGATSGTSGQAGGAGGAPTTGAGFSGIAISGGTGGGGAQGVTSGAGGGSALGGFGATPAVNSSAAGIAAVANSGSGGSGGMWASGTNTTGSGGGAGAFISGVITGALSATYAYAVGAAGASGAGGVGTVSTGGAGGAGGAGFIMIEAHFE